MEKQTAVYSLKESIRLLEIRQAEEGQAFKVQFKITYESLKPINLIKSSLNDLTSSAEIRNNVFESIVSILSGYFTRKMMVSSTSNPFMKILGVIMQYGVTTVVASNAESIRNYIMSIIDRFIHPEEKDEVPETEV
jgi:hypothetical protein